MSDHNRQQVIELDGNCSLDEQFKQLIAKLDTCSLRRAVVPTLLYTTDEDEIPEENDAVRDLMFVFNCSCWLLWKCAY